MNGDNSVLVREGEWLPAVSGRLQAGGGQVERGLKEEAREKKWKVLPKKIYNRHFYTASKLYAGKIITDKCIQLFDYLFCRKPQPGYHLASDCEHR